MNSEDSAFRTNSHPTREALQDEVVAQHAELEQLRGEAIGRPTQRRWIEWIAACALGVLVAGTIGGLSLQSQQAGQRAFFASMQSGAIALRPEQGEERCLLRFERPNTLPYPRASVSCGVNLFDAEIHDIGTRLVDSRVDDGDGMLLVDFEARRVVLNGEMVFVMEQGTRTASRETQDQMLSDLARLRRRALH